MYRPTILLLAFAAGACAPLRQTRTTDQCTVALSDTTLLRLLRRETDRSTGTLRQLVVEYALPAANPATAADPARSAFPASPADTAAATLRVAARTAAAALPDPATDLPPDLRSAAPQPANAPPASAPVRRIIRTELTLQRDRTTDTDSLARTKRDSLRLTEHEEQLRERSAGLLAGLRRLLLPAVLLAAVVLLLRLRR